MSNIEEVANTISKAYQDGQQAAINHALSMININIKSKGQMTADEFDDFVKKWFPNAKI